MQKVLPVPLKGSKEVLRKTEFEPDYSIMLSRESWRLTKCEKTRETLGRSLRHIQIFRPPSAFCSCGQHMELQACQVYYPACDTGCDVFVWPFWQYQECTCIALMGIVGTQEQKFRQIWVWCHAQRWQGFGAISKALLRLLLASDWKIIPIFVVLGPKEDN